MQESKGWPNVVLLAAVALEVFLMVCNLGEEEFALALMYCWNGGYQKATRRRMEE